MSGKIDDARFAKMSKRYEQEQSENAKKIKALRLELKKDESKRMDIDDFLETVRRYTDAATITKRMVAELIDHIEVYHAEKQDGVTNQCVVMEEIQMTTINGIEYSACLHEPTPQELLDRMELFVHLWNALNSLPEVQGVRVEAHLILGKSYRQIAREQGVDKSVVRRSVKRGMAAMKKYLKKVL